jgi:SAM-dependent methyltransferase
MPRFGARASARFNVAVRRDAGLVCALHIEMKSSESTLGPAQPIVGAPRDEGCSKTISVIKSKLAGMSPLRGQRLLDVGCGDGSFTIEFSRNYEQIYGIDVQEPWLRRFQLRVQDDPRFCVSRMSASAMGFPDNYFDTLVTVEVIEHIPDLAGASREFHRVIKPKGELLITCPNRLFPFENHGIRVGGKEYPRRIPLITYLPPLHTRLSLARVFTVRKLEQLFGPLGFVKKSVDYAWPTFEHGGNPFQPLLKPFFGLMRAMEASPLRMFGTSIVIRFEKQ